MPVPSPTSPPVATLTVFLFVCLFVLLLLLLLLLVFCCFVFCATCCHLITDEVPFKDTACLQYAQLTRFPTVLFFAQNTHRMVKPGNQRIYSHYFVLMRVCDTRWWDFPETFLSIVTLISRLKIDNIYEELTRKYVSLSVQYLRINMYVIRGRNGCFK